jgi:4-hydroxy-3-methylbut-2-en-1-yl diphosphate reductase
LGDVSSIGVTAGASAPETLVDEVIDAFRARYEVTLDLVETAKEDVEFKVPRILRMSA